MTSNQHITDAVYLHNALFAIFALLVLSPLWFVREYLAAGVYFYLAIPLSVGALYYSIVFYFLRSSYLSKWYWKFLFLFEGGAMGVACFTKWAVDSKVNESLLWLIAFAVLAIVNVSADYGFRTLEDVNQ
ncbi:hypothetical protein ABC502_03005 [Alkalimonas sp. NCh-2]|uniref:hypothetical protein n=1 Tax=Alkalimonas sp. NCh-2 TaxID=3144846 RepID=UPI0031F6255F